MVASGLLWAAAGAGTWVRPIFSPDRKEAPGRVREPCHSWYREGPTTANLPQPDVSVRQGRGQVQEMLMRSAHVTDPRVIDLLEVEEAIIVWKQRAHTRPGRSHAQTAVMLSLQSHDRTC